jgi:hypothetical protein
MEWHESMGNTALSLVVADPVSAFLWETAATHHLVSHGKADTGVCDYRVSNGAAKNVIVSHGKADAGAATTG